jgi:hypothetical protein
MSKRTRRKIDAALKARIALEAARTFAPGQGKLLQRAKITH